MSDIQQRKGNPGERKCLGKFENELLLSEIVEIMEKHTNFELIESLL